LLAILDWTKCAAVERVPGKVSGAWVFKTTRVPVRVLFENLEDGATMNELLTWFPSSCQLSLLMLLGCPPPDHGSRAAVEG
jgi:uncharacterized protein (DUF433 family)